MAKVYYRLVLSGDRSLASVPDRWRTEVADMLAD